MISTNLRKMKKTIYTIVMSLSAIALVNAQEIQAKNENTNQFKEFFTQNIDYQVRAHFSIGGSAPLGLPREIRRIDSYNPGLQLGLEANATKWLTQDKQWGLRLGLRFENKGMKTEANVTDYLTQINYEGAEIRGYYTGQVETNVKNTYLTVPVTAVYKINDNWNIYGGLYLSALIDKRFDGYVSDGEFRKNTPIGEKISFLDGSKADYDFSDEVRKFQWGTQVGAEWKMNKHFFLLGELSYGFNGVLNSDFDAISFSMHNIYLNLGFGYQF